MDNDLFDLELINDDIMGLPSSILTNSFEKDNILIEKLVNNLAKYDKSELLQRISALRLSFENRDKAFLLDAITTEVLKWLSQNDWNFEGIPMSYGKFKKVIGSLNQFDSKIAIDPLDEPYIDGIQFYGNHKVMPGINLTSSYNLKIVIQSIFLSGRFQLSKDIFNEVFSLLNENLNISTNICSRIGSYKDNIHFNREVFIPSKDKLDKHIKLIQLDSSEGKIELLIDKEDFDLKENTSFSQERHTFITHPYLKTSKGTIVLDVTSISYALVMKIKELLPQDYEEAIFDEFWADIRGSLKRLGHHKVKKNSFGISLIDDGDYKEGIFSVANDKLMIVFGLFNGIGKNTDFSKKMSDRLKLIVSELNKKAIDNYQIFTLAICQTLSGKIFTSIESDKSTNSIPFAYFDAMELRAISVVEKDDLFLPRFMRAKMQLQNPRISSVVSDFTAVTIFSENDLSFYITDDIDYREVDILMGVEENTEYYEQYLQKYNEKTFLSLFDDNWYSSIKEEFSNRYFVKPSISRVLRCFIETKNEKIIEVVTDQFNSNEDMNILFNCLDLISYWIEQYYSLVDIHENVGIYIRIDDEVSKYYLDEGTLETDCLADLERVDNIVICRVSPDLYKSLGKVETNILEKETLSQIVKTIDIQFDDKAFDAIFFPEYKKKIVGSILDDEGKLRLSTNGYSLLKISEYEINLLLDELGIHLKRKGYEYGQIKDSSNSKFSNEIVGFLFSLLESEVKIFDKGMLLEILLAQIETLLPEQLRGESSYNNNIALSASEKEVFSRQIEDNNRNSIATKFLLEYVVATPINGERVTGVWELERLLAICSLILEWAHRSDYFQYNFVNTKINFLKSNRIGLRKEDFKKVDLAMMASRKNQLAISDTPFFDDSDYSSKFDNILKSKLDKAFMDAFDFSYTNFSLVIGAITDLHSDLNEIVLIVNKDYLIQQIVDEIKCEVGLKEIKLILNSITLSEREKYLKAPIGFNKLDIFPWRFNRRLSFIRRPLIEYEENYMFGIRNLIYAKKYLLRLIWTGRLKTESKLMKDLMSKLRNLEGDRFNSRIMKILESYPDLYVLKGVSKIGKTRILDENNNILGDIDVLAINSKTKKIYVIETKDFNFSRNPYEIAMEQEKVFTGDKSFISKHLKRTSWMKENFALVKDYFSLSQGKWSIIPMFIVSEHLITRDLSDTNGVLFVSMKELNSSIFN